MVRRMGRGIGLVAVALAFGWGCVGFGAWTPAPLCRINCPFFLSGYCHERGAGEGALAVALAWLRRGGVAVKDVVDGGGGAEVEVACAAAAIGVGRW